MKKRQVAIALLVVGIILLAWGYQISGSFSSRISQAFGGAAPDKAMVLYVAGAVCTALGLFRLIK
jgi:drug/metabolite transporter (DMT)-like permease